MRQRIAFFVFLGFGVFGLVAPACSSNDATAPVVDAAIPDVMRSPLEADTLDANNCGSGAGDYSCFNASIELNAAPTTLAPVTHQQKCASDDLINQFLAACIPDPIGSGLDAGTMTIDSGADADADTDAAAITACDAFTQANSDCALCLGGFSVPDGGLPPSSPWAAFIGVDFAGDVQPAVAACVASLSTGTDACKLSYATVDLCARSSCLSCTGTDVAACESAESTNPTSTCFCASPFDATCAAAVTAVSKSDADSKCGASTTITTDADFNAVFLSIGRTFCE